MYLCRKDDDAAAIGSHLIVPKGNGVLLVPIWNKLHWSLLAFHTTRRRFYHADSLDMVSELPCTLPCTLN